MALNKERGNKTSYKVLRDFSNLVKPEERYKRDFDALQDLHNEYGFDFTKDYFARIINGKFTQNSIKKEFNIDFDNSVVVVVSLAENYKRFCVARLTESNIILPKSNAFSSRLSNFYAKSDFEDYRKTAKQTLLIAQTKDNLTETKKRYSAYDKKPTDLLQRFNYYDENNHDYGIIPKESRKIWDNKIMGRSMYSYNYFCPVLDKSGYILNIKQDDLKRSAERLRAERNKARYNNMQNIDDMILKCENAIRAKRDYITELLKVAETIEEVTTIEEKLSHWSGLGSCITDLSRIKKGVKNEGFSSPENFNKAILEIYHTLERI